MISIPLLVGVAFLMLGLTLMKELFLSIFYRTWGIIRNILIAWDVGYWPWKIIMGFFNLAIGIFILFVYFYK